MSKKVRRDAFIRRTLKEMEKGKKGNKNPTGWSLSISFLESLYKYQEYWDDPKIDLEKQQILGLPFKPKENQNKEYVLICN